MYYGEEVWQNEDLTYTVVTSDGETVLTKDELIIEYFDDRVRIIPVVDGATMLIENLLEPERKLEYYPGGYVFIDEECTVLAKDVGQLGNYYSGEPFTFVLYDTAKNGMNVFAYEFPLDLLIDREIVSYAILTVSEEKAQELIATLDGNENMPESMEVTEDTLNENIPAEGMENNSSAEKNKAVARPTTTRFEVNGRPVTLDAYLIENNNYVKLRDFAMAVNGTPKQFSVTWNQEKKAIEMYSNTPYEPVGGEMTKGDGKEKDAEVSIARIYVDNEEVSLKAYTIGGYNYFKLRDIAKIFDIGVVWEGETSTVKIDTGIGYED
ncbi:stalk domain-containing protein [Thermoclostridium stercorarium]|uniref:stalk domain-containing protein n=1 Tax=Thermoclostridium stercorarium TaxID=1510 RepID=UPI002248C711|nr:stalk domain-containing protein [Thermoclostridium stercorarium]UZQ85254.1 stalk domain-containing protein [Thermoclostridium stercorarium]